MLSCLYLTRARSKPTPEPGGPPPVARVRVCSDVRTSALATLGGARGEKAPRAPKNQSASRRPADSPSDPPLFPIAFSRSLLELAVQGVLAEVRVVLHELQALGGVAAVLRASERREGRIRRTGSVSRFFFFDSKPFRRRRRRLRTRRRRRLETRERTSDTRRRRLLSRVVVDGFASRARALSMTRRVAVEPFKDEKARRKTKALSIGFRVTRSPTMPICALLYPPGVGRCAARERLGDAKLPGTRSRTFWDM